MALHQAWHNFNFHIGTERDLRFIYTTGSQVVSYVVTINKTDPSTLLVKQTKLSDGGSDVKPLGWHFSNNMLYFGDINKRIMYSGYLTSSTNNFGEHTVNADVQGNEEYTPTGVEILVNGGIKSLIAFMGFKIHYILYT